MDPLVKRLGASPPLNVEVMPLIDTLIHLTLALGSNVEPYALPLLQHALATATANLSAVNAADTSDMARAAGASSPHPPPNGAKYPTQNPASGGHGPPDGAMFALPIVTYALDLISALIEVLRRSSDALLSAVGCDAVPSLALACARCPNACVQQSAFALIGELSNQVPNIVAQCQGAAMLYLCYEMMDPDRIMEVSPPTSPETGCILAQTLVRCVALSRACCSDHLLLFHQLLDVPTVCCVAIERVSPCSNAGVYAAIHQCREQCVLGARPAGHSTAK